jgi:IPT/TIG domain
VKAGAAHSGSLYSEAVSDVNRERRRFFSIRFERFFLLGLFTFHLLLLGPWLLTDLSDQPWNNGYIYVGMARLFRDHPWTWNPLQYGGAPLRYLYPPIFPTLVGFMPGMSLGHAFHLITGIAFAATPVCLYILAVQLCRSRRLAALAAIAWSVFPSLTYLMPQWRSATAPFEHAGWGFVSIVAYDEAPHAFAIPFMLLAVAAAWSNRWKLAAVLTAAVFLTSWPGLVGLGFAMAGIAVARIRSKGALRSLAYAGGIIGAGYGLAAFWMTAGYFGFSTTLNRVVLRHTLLNAPWKRETWVILAVAAILVGLSFLPRVPARLALTTTWVALAGLVVVSYTLTGSYLLPFPHRYMLELNAGSILLCVVLLSFIPGRLQTAAVAVVFAAGIVLSLPFLRHAWTLGPPEGKPQTGPAYQTAAWLKAHAQGAGTRASRIFASGELDSTLNLWTDVPQVGGTGQDVSNFLIFAAERQIAFGCGADAGKLAELWLRALNVNLAVVHGAESREYFHWYSDSLQRAGLPVEHDDGAGNVVYRVPGVEGVDAVVVDLEALRRLPPLATTGDIRALNAYVAWAAGKRPVVVRWNGDDDAVLDVELKPGEGVLLKVNNDPGWSASGATIESDPIGFQLIRPKPGQRTVRLRFGGSWDTWLGRGITVLTILLMFTRLPGIWIATAAVVPSVLAWVILIAGSAHTARIAEDAFVRVQPPLINPGGIVDASYRQPPFARGSVVAIYGLNFGSARDAVKVWMGDRAIDPVYHGANQVQFQLPADAVGSVPLRVEVNGCRGNAFAVEVQ